MRPSPSPPEIRAVFALTPGPSRLPVAVKAGVTMAVLLAGSLLWTGDIRAGTTAGIGAFTVLYGPTTVARWRLRLMLAVGTGLVASVALGALTAGHPLLEVLALTVTAGTATFVCQAWRIGPPGALFFVLVHGVGALAVTHHASPSWLVGLAALGALVATAVGMSDLVADPHGPQRRAVERAEQEITAFEDETDLDRLDTVRREASAALHAAWTAVTDAGSTPPWTDRLWKAQDRYSAVTSRVTGHLVGLTPHPSRPGERPTRAEEGAPIRDTSLGRPSLTFLVRRAAMPHGETALVVRRVVIAAVAAGTAAMLLGTTHLYWAVATATLMLHQGGSRRTQTLRGAHRLMGTLAGLVLFAAVSTVEDRPLLVAVVLVALQFCVELLIARNYGYAVALITPLALTISVQANGSGGPSTAALAAERAIDTLLGVIVAGIVLWCTARRRPEVQLRAHARCVVTALEAVLTDLSSGRVEHRAARENRRRLYADLLDADDVARRVVADSPDEAGDYRRMERSLSQLGYLVLGAAWHPDTRTARALFEAAREPLHAILARRVVEPRPASEIHDDVLAVEHIITTWAR